MKGPARLVAASVLGFGLFAGTAEVAVRLLSPTPRGQILRGAARAGVDVHEIEVLHGEPVWTHSDSALRQDPGCAEGATDVVLLGSSILWGTGVGHDETVSHFLQQDLNTGGEAWCVRNHAQPAFVGTNKLAVAKDVLPAVEPAVVVWEVWANDAGDYTMIGPDAYNVGFQRVDAAGYPVAVPFVPTGLHHLLFEHSKAWEYLSLALAPTDPEAYDRSWNRMTEEILPELLALTTAHGGRLVLVFVPFLDRSFAESVTFQQTKLRGYVKVDAWARSRGVAEVDVASAWVDRDPADVRHDPCCHYNPVGHRALAALLVPAIRAEAARAEEDR